MGGEYAGANPLAMEQAPPARRGFVGALIGSAYPWGFIAISVATLLMLTSVGDEAYLQWGWRVPFILGGVLGIILFFQFARVPESEAWLKAKRENAQSTREGSLRTLFRGVNGRKLAQVIVVTMGMWWGSAALVSATPRFCRLSSNCRVSRSFTGYSWQTSPWPPVTWSTASPGNGSGADAR